MPKSDTEDDKGSGTGGAPPDHDKIRPVGPVWTATAPTEAPGRRNRECHGKQHPRISQGHLSGAGEADESDGSEVGTTSTKSPSHHRRGEENKRKRDGHGDGEPIYATGGRTAGGGTIKIGPEEVKTDWCATERRTRRTTRRRRAASRANAKAPGVRGEVKLTGE